MPVALRASRAIGVVSNQRSNTMFDAIAYAAGLLFGTFGPALILAVLTALPRSKEE